MCVHACMCGMLCLSGGKLVKRGRSDEDHSNSRKTPRSDWLNTADCTHERCSVLIALPRVRAMHLCLSVLICVSVWSLFTQRVHFRDAHLDSWGTVSQCYQIVFPFLVFWLFCGNLFEIYVYLLVCSLWVWVKSPHKDSKA